MSPLEVTIDAGDGSGFAVRELDGASVAVIDRSLGDLPGFARTFRTEANWDGTRLVALTTLFSETAEAVRGGVTRLRIFSLLEGGRELVVERTGYRDNMPSPVIPRVLHHGRMEDDLIYSKDTAFYVKVGQQ